MQVSEKLLKKCKPTKGHVLVLKSLPASMKAYGGFQWPESGAVFAPDWKPTEECGNGLHGWLWGAGDAGLRCMDDDAKWLVLSVPSDFVDLGQKVKFPSCEIKYLGDRETAVAIIQHYAPGGTPAMFGTATAGDEGTATAGYRGTATAGYEGTATAGDEAARAKDAELIQRLVNCLHAVANLSDRDADERATVARPGLEAAAAAGFKI